MTERRAQSASRDPETFLKRQGFEIHEKIDSGGYGVVYKAKKNGQVRAVKVVRIQDGTENLEPDLQREVAIISRIQHPNIIRTYDILRTKRKLYIFMEYASGGTVGKYIRKNGFMPEWSAKIIVFAPMAHALRYLHSLNITHRDLKLDNFLLDQHMVPKLTDFGLSRYLAYDKHGKCLSDTFCGTESYMPPEVLQQHIYDPFKADVWSLGICLYVMLNDTYPFDRKNKDLMMKKQMAKDWNFVPETVATISSECKDFLDKLLEPDVSKRYTMEQCLKHHWMPDLSQIKNTNGNLNQ
ncbi:Testis-specific serine/threonine-protein kinase 3 [Halotydeus destructor]|nr:Testis-specific serine/threonine-protein kinase 3 [Halotydeus destructor]